MLMGRFLQFSDLSPLAPSLTQAQADLYIDDIEAQAEVEAPCIVADGFEHGAAVKSILRQAVLRWHRAGEGGVASEQNTTGSFTHTQSLDTRTFGEGRLFTGEVRRLKALCRTSSTGGRRRAFTVAPR
jgi:hypothetical protein